jgi:hypothetical protein
MGRATSETGLAFPVVDFVPDAQQCTVCGSALRVRKSQRRRHAVISVHTGPFIPREVIKECSSDVAHPVVHSAALARIVRPRQQFAYDIMVQVGLARYLRDMRRDEIRAELQQQLGVDLSDGSISNLCDRFLSCLEALHLARVPALREVMQKDGYPLHLDATNDHGKGGVAVCMDGFRGWVLVSEKIASEHEDNLKPLVEKTVELFGDPIATMRDLMTAGPNVVAALSSRGIPDLVCHFHWLAAVAKKLFDGSHATLRTLIKSNKVRSDLRELLRELRRYHKRDSYEGRFGSGEIREELLALVHWALEGDGKKKPLYPFSLPYLECVQRCRQAMQRGDSWVPLPRTQAERRALRSFGSILNRLERDKRFGNIAAELETGWRAFCKLRNVLRVTNADLPRAGEPSTCKTTLPALEQERLQAIKQTTDEYIQQLRDQVGDESRKKPVTPEGIILKYWTRYGHGLFGHPAVRDQQGAVIAVVERTNNVPEHFFDNEKRHLRRRLAKAHLGRDLEDQPAQAFLAANLRHGDYVLALCGSLDNLADALADLDQKALAKASPLVRDNRDSKLNRRIRVLLEQDGHPPHGAWDVPDVVPETARVGPWARPPREQSPGDPLGRSRCTNHGPSGTAARD